jgi:hypothetical protein
VKYRVRWEEAAVQELAAAWVEGDSTLRAEITAATNDLDQRLADDPLGLGESRADGRRIGISSPLVVIFRIDFSQDIVSVSHCTCR